MSLTAISLFSSSGIGDLGLKANNISTVIGCELLPERMRLFHQNHPEATCFCGDIWELKDRIIDFYRTSYTDSPFVILATPPCQGMSPNGMGTILRNFRKGVRPKFDERNIILPDNRTGSERKIKPIKTLSEHGQQLKKKVFSGFQGQSSLGSAKGTDDAAGA